uniref:type IV pilus modification PilV family protein n=1 Tax=Thaumasiovibrio subtropicus TaxID=1891207 RepID=UPI000B359D2B|nr:prepilin-type N-terminal cleavage/methylation domain-containing protein [Thaumasiovibrio subtropicus]
MSNKQKGFSLLESLISLIVLSVGILGLIRLQTFVDQKADYALNSLEALALAESQLELYRTRSSNSSATNTLYFDGASMAANTYPESNISVSGSEYTFDRTTTIANSIFIPPANVSAAAKTITVEVEWTDRWANTNTISMATMVSRYSEFD